MNKTDLLITLGVVVVVVVVGVIIYSQAQADLSECLRIFGDNCTIINGVAY